MNDTYDTEPMSKDEIVDGLKTMVFGVQAFERFNEKERKILDAAWNSILQQEPTGHWIDTERGQICSRCGEIQYGYDNDRRFCANCGAKMVEPEESEEVNGIHED